MAAMASNAPSGSDLASSSNDAQARAWARIVVAGFGLLALSALAWLKHADQFDDASIFLRYARNIAEGHGCVFNPGESVNGTTSIANTMLLAAIGWMSGDYFGWPQVFLFVAGLTIAAVATWPLFRSSTGRVAAVVFLLSLPYLYWLIGMETPLLLAFSLSATASAAARRWSCCALSSAGLAMTRPDGFLLVAILSATFAWTYRDRWRDGIRAAALPALLFVVPTALWASWTTARYGTPLPSTLAAKVAQASSGAFGPSPVFLRGAVEAYVNFCSFRGAAYLGFALVGLGIWGSFVALRTRHPCWPMIAYGLTQFCAYAIIGVPNYVWYDVPAFLTLALGIAVLLDHRWSTRSIRPFLAFVAPAGWLYLHAPDPRWITSGTDPDYMHYRSDSRHPHWYECADWLRSNAPASTLATCEVGILGWSLQDWRIVDMYGLVSPGDHRAIARGEFATWVLAQDPEWIVVHSPAWAGPEEALLLSPGFFDKYELAHSGTGFGLLRKK